MGTLEQYIAHISITIRNVRVRLEHLYDSDKSIRWTCDETIDHITDESLKTESERLTRLFIRRGADDANMECAVLGELIIISGWLACKSENKLSTTIRKVTHQPKQMFKNTALIDPSLVDDINDYDVLWIGRSSVSVDFTTHNN